METLIADAVRQGAKLFVRWQRAIGNKGYFFAPTVLDRMCRRRRAAMNEEPFGPIALVNSFEISTRRSRRQTDLPMALRLMPSPHRRQRRMRWRKSRSRDGRRSTDSASAFARIAFRRRQGQWLWQRGRHRSDGGLSRHQACDAGGGLNLKTLAVMAGLDPAIHAVTLLHHCNRYSSVSAWMPGTRPGMTLNRPAACTNDRADWRHARNAAWQGPHARPAEQIPFRHRRNRHPSEPTSDCACLRPPSRRSQAAERVRRKSVAASRRAR